MRRTIFNFAAMKGTGSYFVLFLLCRGDTNRAILKYSHSEKLILFSVPFLQIFGPPQATSIELPPQATTLFQSGCNHQPWDTTTTILVSSSK